MQAREFYLCPSLPAGEPNFGDDMVDFGNGHFDYAMLSTFAGAKIDLIHNEARLKGESEVTPIIIEEDVNFAMNRRWLDSAHGVRDKSSSIHANGQGHFVGVDGSVHGIDGGAVATTDWEFRFPNGEWGPNPRFERYGSWNTATVD
ncbi:MAG: hypothetical protein AAGB26_11600 [Planctomycetota bacterium]